MKIKIVLVLLLIIAIITSVRIFYINQYFSQVDTMIKYGTTDVNKILNTKFNDITIRGVGTELVFAIEGQTNWDNLPLSDKFKNTYKNGVEIMADIGEYSMISTGRDYDNNGDELIVLFCYNKPSFFDFFDNNPITTVYYYKYSLNEEKKLDSIELVKKEVTDSTTGQIIE